MLDAADEIAALTGVDEACRATGIARATYYRRRRPPARPAAPARPAGPRRPRSGPGSQPRALGAAERDAVLAQLHSERFRDQSAEEVYHTLLDEGVYLCSVATMRRLLRGLGEAKDRRRQSAHPAKAKPELMADAPNQVWSWDITILKGPAKHERYHLYCVIDVFSRKTVAWQVQARESDQLARAMFEDAFQAERVQAGQLTVHADRGSSMTSKTVAQLMDDLQVARSHSRPRVSNDNPYSESQFKTLKYRPEFPDRFYSLAHAREFCAEFFNWYNHHHHHSGIGYHTPAE
ncbi:MAG: IS3 family transposase, partial [Bifidobacteriaceae bacterium]|nr:IS3 family transposase [Bifidobacteriaceae bacterium]